MHTRQRGGGLGGGGEGGGGEGGAGEGGGGEGGGGDGGGGEGGGGLGTLAWDSGQQSFWLSNRAAVHTPAGMPAGGTHSSSRVVQPLPFLFRPSVMQTWAPSLPSPRPSCVSTRVVEPTGPFCALLMAGATLVRTPLMVALREGEKTSHASFTLN